MFLELRTVTGAPKGATSKREGVYKRVFLNHTRAISHLMRKM